MCKPDFGSAPKQTIMLNIADEFTRERLAIKVRAS